MGLTLPRACASIADYFRENVSSKSQVKSSASAAESSKIVGRSSPVFTQSQVVNEAKKAIRLAAKFSDFSQQELQSVLDSMSVQHCIIGVDQCSLHATVQCPDGQYIYSIAFKIENGKLIPYDFVFEKN